jgi:hypothetical protein
MDTQQARRRDPHVPGFVIVHKNSNEPKSTRSNDKREERELVTRLSQRDLSNHYRLPLISKYARNVVWGIAWHFSGKLDIPERNVEFHLEPIETQLLFHTKFYLDPTSSLGEEAFFETLSDFINWTLNPLKEQAAIEGLADDLILFPEFLSGNIFKELGTAKALRTHWHRVIVSITT